MVAIWSRVPERLSKKMKDYVKKMKEERSYSIQELIRESVEKYLQEEKQNEYENK